MSGPPIRFQHHIVALILVPALREAAKDGRPAIYGDDLLRAGVALVEKGPLARRLLPRDRVDLPLPTQPTSDGSAARPEVSAILGEARRRAATTAPPAWGPDAVDALERAVARTVEAGRPVVDWFLLLVCLLNEPGGRAAELARRSGIDVDEVVASLRDFPFGYDRPWAPAVWWLEAKRPRRTLVVDWLVDHLGKPPTTYVVAREAARQAALLGRRVVTPVELFLAVVSIGDQLRLSGEPLRARYRLLPVAPAALRAAGIDLAACLAWAQALDPTGAAAVADRKPPRVDTDDDPSWTEEALRALDEWDAEPGNVPDLRGLTRTLVVLSAQVRAFVESRAEGDSPSPDDGALPWLRPEPDAFWGVEDVLATAYEDALKQGRATISPADLAEPLPHSGAGPTDLHRAEAVALTREVAWEWYRNWPERRRPPVPPRWDDAVVDAVAHAVAASPAPLLDAPVLLSLRVYGQLRPRRALRGWIFRRVQRLAGSSAALAVLSVEAARHAVRHDRAVGPADLFLAVVSAGDELRANGLVLRAGAAGLAPAADLLAAHGIDLPAAVRWVAALEPPADPPALADRRPGWVDEPFDPVWTVDAARTLDIAPGIARVRRRPDAGSADVLLALCQTAAEVAGLLRERGVDLGDLRAAP
jgi:hypothetical protein